MKNRFPPWQVYCTAGNEKSGGRNILVDFFNQKIENSDKAKILFALKEAEKTDAENVKNYKAVGKTHKKQTKFLK